MKLIRIFLFLSLFASSLVVSRNISLAIFHPEPEAATIIVDKLEGSSSEYIDGSQLNILIFHITSLAEPDLRSAWWITLTSNSPVTMIDIFPSLLNTRKSTNQSFERLEMIKDQRNTYQLSQSMIDQLKIRKIPWDGYIVLDDVALQVLVDYLGGAAVDDEVLDGTQVVSLGPLTLPAHEIWESICQKSLFASSPASFELVRKGLIQHSVVSPDFPISIKDYHTFNISSQSTSCNILEFDIKNTDGSDLSTSLSEED